MCADFGLPQPHPANLLGAGLAGYGAVQDIQTGGLQQEGMREALELQRQKRAALAQAAQTGDYSGLMAVDPVAAANISKIQATRMQTGMDYLYSVADQVKSNPAMYPQVRQKAIQMGLPAEMVPEKIDAATIDQFKTGYERQNKLQPEMVPVLDALGRPTGQMVAKGAISTPAAALPQTVFKPEELRSGQVLPPYSTVLPREPKSDETKVLYVNPKDPRQWDYGPPNDPNMKARGLVPKELLTQVGQMGTPGSRLMNAKAWILGTKPMTSFRGEEKKEIAEMAFNAGFDTQDMGQIQSTYKALNASKSRLSNQQALIEAFTNNAKLNMELGTKISEGVNRVGSPAANAWLQWFQGKIMGQEVPMTQDVKAFQAIVGPTANEWAKVMTSATGAGGVVSDAARKETWDLLNTTLNKSQFKNVGEVMIQELNNRGKGINMEHQRIDTDISKITKYVDDKFAAAYPELVRESPVQRPGATGQSVTNPQQLPVGKAMKVGGKVVGMFQDGLYYIDSSGNKVGRYTQ